MYSMDNGGPFYLSNISLGIKQCTVWIMADHFTTVIYHYVLATFSTSIYSEKCLMGPQKWSYMAGGLLSMCKFKIALWADEFSTDALGEIIYDCRSSTKSGDHGEGYMHAFGAVCIHLICFPSNFKVFK